ncbi:MULTISPECIES: MFS transporter [Streptomyces]|uniref:MFS transporter n=1 Tax=Streptomyces siderophoricus TaxID=2802281 RepID=A0ABS1N2Q7_9ACTN|nr:MFS transporter [Streptomyces sp. 9-7]MBL1094356.1 MFS transporter [Streptomyces sp. 9-7]
MKATRSRSAWAGVRAVVGIAGVGLPVLSFLARLPAALCPIGTLLLLTEVDGIGRAGVVAGVLWLGQAVGGAPVGRLADRRGHRPVILVASLVNAGVIVALVGAVLAGLPAAVQAVLAGLTGATMPQVGPLSRTRWSVLTASGAAGPGRREPASTPQELAPAPAGGPDGHQLTSAPAEGADGHRLAPAPAPAEDPDGHELASVRPAGPDGKELTGRALSLDTTIDEISFMVGPALAATVGVLCHPAAGLLLAAVLGAVCGVLFAVHPTAPGPVRTGRGAAAAVPLVSPGLIVLWVMAWGQGVIWGGANAGVSALSKELGAAGMAGFVWGGMAVTSALAGLVTTALPVKRDLTVRLRWAIVAQTLLVLPLPAVDGFVGASLVIAGIGVAVAPHLIAVFGLGERIAPAARMGEAMGLLGAGLIIGQCVAAVVAGPLAEAYGYRAAFGLSCGAGPVACAVALLFVRGRRFGPLPDGAVGVPPAPAEAGRGPTGRSS